ncbi:MAG: hypothetical protein QME59_02430 [Candidatus Hydrothermarchaeota archaeon]|nr:hypothetical protein [Candidatus Hydrothermarchaeota archaeon]
MSLEGHGRFYQHVRGRIILYIPSDVHKDSAFPFEVGEKAKVIIKRKKLVIEKA